MTYQLLTRGFAPPKAGKIIRLGSFLILACTPKSYREKARQNALKKITQYNNQKNFEVAAIETMASLQKSFATDILDSYIDLPFEDSTFKCFTGWDDYLHRKFGDYMKFPPEEERKWRHHPIVIDFEHNYEELNLSE